MTEAQLAQRAKGIVRFFNEAGVLVAADVHVATRSVQPGGETSEEVMLAAALAVRAVRSGSVCLDLQRMRDVSVRPMRRRRNLRRCRGPNRRRSLPPFG